ncbi:solute carrier family 22 member 15-like [Tubulanus polymorphus]|uniref:solute carrier family 22 member 15-like n=1 Tax=Tubulanus polymorphus TaxID=672921 RepID=UPI003DA5C8AA
MDGVEYNLELEEETTFITRDKIRKHKSGQNSEFDDIFETLGDLGFYQLWVYVMSNVLEISATLSVMYFVFECADPGWKCASIECENSCVNLSLPNSTDGFCSTEDLVCINRTFNPTLTSALTEWNLVCRNLWKAKTIISIFFAAVGVGAIIGGQVSDTFGRRWSLFIVWIMLSIFQTCLRFAPNYYVYCVIRVITGIFAGALDCISPVLSLEWMSPKWRIIASWRFSWQTSLMFIALLAYLCRDWQTLTTAVGLITIPLFPLYYFFFPESSRWLVQKGRFEKAEYWIRKAMWFNRLSPRTDLREFLENVARTENKRQERTVPYTYLDLFHNRKMSIWTIVLIYETFTLAISWYGINSSISSLTGNIYSNVAVSGIGAFVIGLLSIYVINWVGRVKSYVLFISLTGCCLIVILAMKVTDVAHNNPMVVTYFSLASISLMTGGWCAARISCWELYPTLMRNIATGCVSMGTKLGSIISPFIILLATFHGSIPYVIFATASFSSGILAFLSIPETKNKPLPDGLPSRNNQKTKPFAKCSDSRGFNQEGLECT